MYLAMFVEVKYVPIAVAMCAGVQYISLSIVRICILVVLLVQFWSCYLSIIMCPGCALCIPA